MGVECRELAYHVHIFAGDCPLLMWAPETPGLALSSETHSPLWAAANDRRGKCDLVECHFDILLYFDLKQKIPDPESPISLIIKQGWNWENSDGRIRTST